MPKGKIVPKHLSKSEANADQLFRRADKEWDRGRVRSAFRLFLAAADAGDKGAQLNIGYFYDNGIGIKKDRSAALYWYKQAYRRGDASAANNIGTIWRDEGKLQRALTWFQRAVRLGNEGSNLEIAKHYLRKQDARKAIGYLEKVCQSDHVSEEEVTRAKKLLKDAKRG